METVEGTLLKGVDLSYATSELFYQEVTNACNLRCEHCGVRNNLELNRIGKTPLNKDAKYITKDFIQAIEENIRTYPPLLTAGHRQILYGGGEPLMDPSKFARIHKTLDQVESTTRIVVTNGLALPLQEQGLVEFVNQIGNPHIMLTYSESHKRQYTALARSKNDLSDWIPDVNPEYALPEKVKTLNNLCTNNGIYFTVNFVYPRWSDPPQELRELILSNAFNHVQTDINGKKTPCEEYQETAIDSLGNMYPHCLDLFARTNKLGVIGFLRSPIHPRSVKKVQSHKPHRPERRNKRIPIKEPA